MGTSVSGHRRTHQRENAGDRCYPLEANAALRSIVRRDTGESYNEFLTKLAKESGIETPTRADLAKLDRKVRRKDLTRTGNIRMTPTHGSPR